MPLRFGPFTADRTAYRVERDGAPVELTPKLLDLLFHFLDHPAVLVTKEELLDRVWPGANVTENALAQAISDLRDALGDRASAPTYIRTVARRGYRFIAPVEREDGEAAPATAAHAQDGDRRTIAALDFQNVTGDPTLDWLAVGIAETVTSDLAALDAFHVVDRWRVVLAAGAATGTGRHDLARALGADLVVTGSYQRHGPRLRITARLVDVAGGQALSDVKLDGALDEVFELQDGIVPAFARELDLPGVTPTARIGVRETASLDAYRAFSEGTIRIESLDTGQIRDAISDFARAIGFDSGYAMAYTGLANAQCVAYEMTRSSATPDLEALGAGLAHARRAIDLDDHLAEAHATLSFLLVSAGDYEAARAAAHRAVALEPDSWRQQYRLGHASWGAARLRALERTRARYAQFPFAAFETVMVHVARGQLDAAERVVRQRVDDPGGATGAARFPAVGFHWLQGALDAAGGRRDAAMAAFDRELATTDPGRLYGPEYAAEALTGRGHALLADGRPHEALESFQAAFAQVPGFPRAHVGEALALDRLKQAARAAAAWAAVDRAATSLDGLGRRHDALILRAVAAAARGRPETAVEALDESLSLVPPGHVGWWLPIEPALAPVRDHAGIAAILARLAERAR